MTTSSDSVEPPDRPPQTLILLDRVRQGDTAAVNGLLQRHRAAIRRMIDQRLDRVVRKRVVDELTGGEPSSESDGEAQHLLHP